MKMGVGLIGTGRAARVHIKALRQVSGAQLRAIYSLDPSRAQELAGQSHARAYTTLAELLSRPEIHSIHVCTSPASHGDLALEAIRAGKHVLIEKPIEMTLAKGQQIVEAAEVAGVRVGVIYQLRTFPGPRRAKVILDGGGIGRLTHVSCAMPFYCTGSQCRLDGGGALINQGIHGVDLLQWLAGPISEVVAACSAQDEAKGVEDLALAILRFRRGHLGSILASTISVPDQPLRIELVGTAGRLVIEGTGQPVLTHWERGSWDGQAERVISQDKPSRLTDDEGAHRTQIQDFYRSILHGQEPMVTGAEGLKSLAVVEAIYRSQRERAWVPVETSVW